MSDDRCKFKLVLQRHGESVWNKQNRFTGWTDVELTERGIEEAKNAGQTLKENGFSFDLAYTSVLKRAIETLEITLSDMGLSDIPIIKSWRLNERHYGALQGLNKTEMAEKFGEKQVHTWRRSYDVRPPELSRDDERFPGHDPLYKDVDPKDLPTTECLKDTVKRFLPFWHETIAPSILSGKRVLISVHGNSLRALVKYLDNISNGEIIKLNIPTGVPLVYELDQDCKSIRHYYLGDADKIQPATDAVARQGQAKK